MDPVTLLQSQHHLSPVKEKNKGLSPKKSKLPSSTSFSNILQQANHTAQVEEESGIQSKIEIDDLSFEQALDTVFMIGEELKKDHGLRKLMDYKKAVRHFLDMVLKNAYKHIQIKGAVNPRTMLQREYSLIQVVDERLERLARAVLSEQSEAFSILERIDEIRGLLIDYRR